MCAIFGWIGEVDEQKAVNAFDALHHRGPDSSNIVRENDLFLGHHRLSIVDPEDTHANQPMRRGDITMLFNGEIYNYKELGFDTSSDSEALLLLYAREGEKFTQKLRGMYAIAFYHHTSGSLYLYRDPFGKKPLYYAYELGSFYFASEIKAILPLLKNQSHWPHLLNRYLSFQSSIAPATCYSAISQLPSGSSLCFENGEIVCKQFYDLLETKNQISNKDKALEKIESHLKESVNYRLVSDVKVAALLSGGIDSSLVCAMAKKEQESLETFCIGYEGYEKYDERPYAKEVATHIGSEHTEIVLSKADFFESLESVISHMDMPLADPAIVPLHFMTQKIHQRGIKVLLTGDGADELFFGYTKYIEVMDVEQIEIKRFAGFLKKQMYKNFVSNKEWEWHKRLFEGTPIYRSMAEMYSDRQQNNLLIKQVEDDFSLKEIAHYRQQFEESSFSHSANWYSFIDLKVMMGEVYLSKLDRMSMLNSIEARSPFLDTKLVELAFGIDPELRFGNADKTLLKAVAKKYIPHSVIERRKKGFSYPFIEWMNEEGELDRITQLNSKYKLFDPEMLDFMIGRAKLKGKFKYHLFSIYMYLRWLDKSP
jgi:asparagine synthase (glutamine-hydrolysing)